MSARASYMQDLEDRGLRAVTLDETDSTNSEARRRAEAGDSGGLWIRADRQVQGRGRRGRNWISPEGNLMATVLLRPECSAAVAAQLSYVAALAVADLVKDYVAPEKIRLKWPNDVLVGGKKIAGILLESGSQQGRLDWLAVGIGVNLSRHPDDTDRPATDLAAETGAGTSVPGPDEALCRLALAFNDWQRIWASGQGFQAIRTAWLEKAHGLGETLTARLSGEDITGRFDGLDEAGALRLQLADGSHRTILGGEVFFGQPPSE